MVGNTIGQVLGRALMDELNAEERNRIARSMLSMNTFSTIAL